MGAILLGVIILATCLSALKRPWIGIIAYYLLAILGPQYIWWWNFEELRVSFWVAISTLLGIFFSFLNRRVFAEFLATRLNMWVLLLWLCIIASRYFGAFVAEFNYESKASPENLLSNMNNMYLFYFCSVLMFNDIRKLRYLALVIVVATLYLTYWGNMQFLNQNWNQFEFGRLMGPRSISGGSIYGDQNVFAMLFVTGIPFLYFMGHAVTKKWLRYALWLSIPCAWHVIFLTGSRGGLLGLVVITVAMVLGSKRKILALPIILALFVFYNWQAGDTMKNRSELITEYEGEGSAEMRIAAWKGAGNMIAAHPVTGVGLGMFVIVLPRFYDTAPRVAHNTFLQYTAESGVGAGLSYLLIIGTFLLSSRKIAVWCRNNSDAGEEPFIRQLNSASCISFLGLVITSLFLTLNGFEIFVYLVIINNALGVICLKYSFRAEDMQPVGAVSATRLG